MKTVSFIRILHHLFLFSILFSLCPLLAAQATGLMNQLKEEEKAAVEAIALYPETERAAVLTVAQHPEILVRMEYIRRNTETKFKDLLAALPEEEQKRIYNLARYPELIADMTSQAEKLSADAMDALLKPFAEEIHEDARWANRKRFDLLMDIDMLNHNAEDTFAATLSGYTAEVRDAARQLSSLPAVVSVLNNNMNTTVLLGDLYRRDPARIDHELDSLNVILAEQQAREVDDWKKQLEENPEAMAEYENEAREFAGEEQYDDDVYDGPLPDRYREDMYVHHVWRPYPYWFGWPAWYDYECWYPYPWWYHWGYYYGPQHVIVIISMPSNFFIDWHFRHDHHLYHYPHFTDVMIRHYYGPRGFGERVQPVLRRWEAEHRGELPANWWKDDQNRVDRIREYGKFKMEYDELTKVTREKSPTEREFLRQNADRYPTLKPVLTEQREPSPSREPKTRTNEPKRETAPGEKVIEKEKAPPQEKVDRAKETHENIWDLLRREPKEQPRQEPSPKGAPSKKEQTRPSGNEPKREPAKPTRSEPTKREKPKGK